MRKKALALITMLVLTTGIVACNKTKTTETDITKMDMSQYVTLGEYKNISVSYKLSEVTDEAVDEQVRSIMIANSEKIGLKEGVAEHGDLVNINYVGYRNDVPFEGGTANSQNIKIGEGTHIPGFEEAVIGMAPGETIEADMTFPEDYHNSDLAGQDVVFSITLNFIYPELTDDVVKQMENTKYSTKKELIDHATNTVSNDVESNNKNAVVSLAFDKILENSQFNEVPKEISDNQRASMEKQYASAIEGGAGSLDSVIQYLYGCSADNLIEVYSKQRMVTQAIAKAEGIEVTEEEVDARLTEVGGMYGMDGENYLAVNEITREKFKELMISERVQQFVYENTTAVAP